MSDSDQNPKTDRANYLVPTTPGGEIGSAVAIASEVARIEAKTEDYQERAHASTTRRAYKADWEHFETWCKLYSAQALPADPRLVARYLSAYAGVLSVATLGRRLSGIQFVHVAAELDFDRRERTLRDTWRGIRRTHGVASSGKAPTVTEELRALVSTLDLKKRSEFVTERSSYWDLPAATADRSLFQSTTSTWPSIGMGS